MRQQMLGSTRAHILGQIDAFLAETGISARQLGYAVANCGKIIPKIRSGRPVTLGSIEALEGFMDVWRSEVARAATLGKEKPDIRVLMPKARRIAHDARG